MRVAGLTGGIACGKSTVSRLLHQEHGLPVIDCDLIAHQVTKKVQKKKKKRDGELDRDALARLVFEAPDRTALRRLNKATHLPVAWEVLRQLAWHWATGRLLVVLDVPLLFETGMAKMTRPHTVVVHCSPELQVARLVRRDACTPAAAEARIASQMPAAKKVQLADHVVTNDGSLDELRGQVDQLVARLRRGTVAWGLLTSPLALLAACIGVVAWWRRA